MRSGIFILGIIFGFVLMGAAVAVYVVAGLAPVAVNAAPLPFERLLARTALDKKVNSAAATPSPIQPTEENLLAGAQSYRQTCALCHSLPGSDKTELQKGMYPPPPDLLSGKGVTDDPVGRTHWVVQHGIRLTGMPSFEGTLSDQQLWQVSLLLAQAQDLPASVQALLRSPDTIPFEDLTGAPLPSSASR